MGGKGFEIFNCDVNKKDHDDSQEKDCVIRIITNNNGLSCFKGVVCCVYACVMRRSCELDLEETLLATCTVCTK